MSEENWRCGKCLAEGASVDHMMWKYQSTEQNETWPGVATRMRRNQRYEKDCYDILDAVFLGVLLSIEGGTATAAQ